MYVSMYFEDGYTKFNSEDVGSQYMGKNKLANMCISSSYIPAKHLL